MTSILRKLVPLKQSSCTTVAVTSAVVTTFNKYAPMLNYQQTANYPNSKHWNLKWRELRRRKVYKIDLPDFDKIKKDRNKTPDEQRMHMKKEGQMPPRSFMERPINISSTSGVFEAFVPPEGDGRSSVISKQGIKTRYTELEKRGKSFLELRKVRKYEEGFDTKVFASYALELYIQAHNLLQNIDDNVDKLHECVSEKAYPEMIHGIEKKTFTWEFIESIEPPRVMHVRTTDMLSKENLYAQVTVRMHTKQKMAIYDRFGRLMYGSPTVPKDVLEYVVFEKHIANVYGQWRLHGKLVPDWMPPGESVKRTLRMPKFEPIEEEVADSKDDDKAAESKELEKSEQGPAVATA